jgi:hypothetical protein
VIKNEIIPYIDSIYPADKTNRALCGGSFGGLFALYTLFHEPTLFNRYIVMGPSLFYDNELTFKYERQFAEKNKTLNAKIFLSSGEYEEDVDFSKGFTRFVKQLKASNYRGLELESLVADKMGHIGEGAYSTGRGLQFIYSRPEIVVDSFLLDKYTGQYKLNEMAVIITRLGNSLFVNISGGKLKLYAETTESFYAKGGGTAQFIKDSTGKITGFNYIMGNATLFLKKMD